MADPIYSKFLGTWVLDAPSCLYEQGAPPRSETHRIDLDGEELVFNMDWVDATGEAHHASFRAKPDGSHIPFDAGPLADTLCVRAKSETELNSSALRDGVELMVAERTLSGSGTTMHFLQKVNLPDGTSPTNRATYHRQQ
ncbi:MAG: hypothetical protein ACRBCJ_14480 [Hyphomicrobiaceae bacterium]